MKPTPARLIAQKLYNGRKYTWDLKVSGVHPIESNKLYTTLEGAYQAGLKWAKKHNFKVKEAK